MAAIKKFLRKPAVQFTMTALVVFIGYVVWPWK